MFKTLLTIIIALSSNYLSAEAFIIGSKINVRANPSINSYSIQTLDKGTKVDIIKWESKTETIDLLTDKWVKIRCDNKTGYIFGAYIFDCDFLIGTWSALHLGGGSRIIFLKNNRYIFKGGWDTGIFEDEGSYSIEKKGVRFKPDIKSSPDNSYTLFHYFFKYNGSYCLSEFEYSLDYKFDSFPEKSIEKDLGDDIKYLINFPFDIFAKGK